MSAASAPEAPVAGAPEADAPEQRRTLTVLVAAQVLSGAGLAAGITVGALLAEQMFGGTEWAGIPTALFTAGAAAASVGIGQLSHRRGRRVGLATGYALGAVGAAGVVAAAVTDVMALLVVALLLYGAGTSTNLQARYAGADLAAPHRRARAVSVVLLATTAGAVVGPNLVTVTGDLAAELGAPRLAGPFGLAALAYGAAALVLAVALVPDPLLVARRRAADAAAGGAAAEPGTVTGRSALLVGTAVMVVTQMVMVAIMTMTPVHLAAHGHGLQAAGLVIAVHVAAMYLPSPLSGLLVDRLGRYRVAALGGVVLVAAGLVAAGARTADVTVLALALALLGLGWNLGLVSGTALVADALPPATRARTQGVVDLLIALAAAGGGLASGVVVAYAGYPHLALAGGVLALALLPVLLVAARRPA